MTKLVVGLGNPGKEYSKTRHNVGFIVLDSYLNESDWKKDKNFYIATKVINGEKVLFIKPITFMNLSGEAVKYVVDYYKINPEEILIIHDDMDLEPGVFRFKYASSSGGHNGIKNIIECLKTDKFSRLKIGIGKNNLIPTADYVLGHLSKEEINIISTKYNDILDYYLAYGIEKSMNTFN